MKTVTIILVLFCVAYFIFVIIPISVLVFKKYYYLVNYEYYANELIVFPRASNGYKERRNESVSVFDELSFFDRTSVVTQLTMDRLPRLEILASRWKHRISAVLYVLLSDLNSIDPDQYLDEVYSSHPVLKDRVEFSLVFGRKIATEYKLNFLRNVAWNASSSEYVFLLDVDFVPCVDFESVYISREMEESLNAKTLFVVPAFDYKCKDDNDLSTCKKVEILKDHPSHHATNITYWMGATQPYEVKYQILYEPYLIASRSIPMYDGTFDIGNDKVQHSYLLAALNYTMIVLPRVYIAHMPHSKSMEWTLHSRKYSNLRAWVKFAKFMQKTRDTTGFNHFCLMSQEEEDIALLPPSMRRIRHLCNTLCTNACDHVQSRPLKLYYGRD